MTNTALLLYYFAMNNFEMLEKVNHETAERPFSIHHTYVGGENTNALYLHCHPQAEFFYMEEGEVTFVVEDRTFLLRGGEAVFIPPGLSHNADKEPGMACRYSALVFSLEWLFGYLGGKGNLYEAFLMKNRYECIRVFRPEEDSCEGMLARLSGFRNYMDLPIQSYEMRLLGELMISMQDIYNAVSDGMCYDERVDASREGVRRGIDYIQLHYDKGIALSELVECSGYSESHFCHRFKAVTGYTPFAYLNRIRISKAAERLVVSDDKITEIAVDCGFDNISYFNRVFRREMGMSPSAYRKHGRHNRRESVAGRGGKEGKAGRNNGGEECWQSGGR